VGRPPDITHPIFSVALLAVAIAASIAAVAQGTLPDLPRLAVDQFPSSAHAAVSKVHQDAVARPTDPSAVGALGRVLHAWEQWDAAHAAYARAQALAPKAFEWHYLDALVLQRLARHDEAAVRLKAALAVSPDYVAARVRLADALFDAGDLAGSRRLYEALAREPTTEPMGHFGLGRIAAAERRHAVAVEHLQRALTLVPDWGAAHYALALSYRALGRRDEAQRALERHAQYGARWPTVEDPVPATVSTLRDDPRATLQRGIRLAERGDVEAAIAAHEAALAADPSLVHGHANLISLYGRARNWTKAEEHYRAAIKAGAELVNAHVDYGIVLAEQQKWDDAAAAYRKALAINPLDARAHNNLGQVLEQQRQIEAALATYAEAVRHQPTFRLARFNMGRMLIALGRNDDAVAALEQIVEPRDAEAPRYLFALATAYVRAGRKDEGIKWATEAQRLARDHGQQDLAAAIERELGKLR
jgi:tetratricopeptide (TPR) repeat protein